MSDDLIMPSGEVTPAMQNTDLQPRAQQILGKSGGVLSKKASALRRPVAKAEPPVRTTSSSTSIVGSPSKGEASDQEIISPVLGNGPWIPSPRATQHIFDSDMSIPAAGQVPPEPKSSPSYSRLAPSNQEKKTSTSPHHVDYLASIVEGHWVQTAPRTKMAAKHSACNKPHLGDPKVSPWICDDCGRMRNQRHGVTCSSFSSLVRGRVGSCLANCCCCPSSSSRLPPYPADFTKPYQPVAYYFRSVE